MTQGAALYQFFSQFLTAYAENSVVTGAELPYLTYTPVFSNFGEGEVNITVNLWYANAGEATPNAKAEEISDAIGLGGVLLPCDGGAIWLKRGSPWCQGVYDAENTNINRRLINISAEFLTI